MRKNVFVLGAVLVLIISGCASAPNYRDKSAVEVAQGVRLVDNEFSAHRAYMAPVVTGKSASTGVGYTARLAASQSKADGGVTNALYVEFNYSNNRWLFISAAALPGGAPLNVVVSDRLVVDCQVSGGFCRYTEKMTALLPLDALTNAKDGLRVSFQGTVVELPRDYVLGYLQGLSKALSENTGG